MTRFLFIFFAFTFFYVGVVTVHPQAVMAAPDDPSYGLDITAQHATITKLPGTPQDNLNTIIGAIINTILAFTGVIFMMILVWAGDLWMTAQGNEEKIDKARGMIFNAAIGLIITFASYIGANFLISFILGNVGA